MSMVPSETEPAALRLNDATILTSLNVPGVVWPIVVSVDSQLAPEKVAPSAKL